MPGIVVHSWGVWHYTDPGEDSSGISAAYTMGSASIRVAANEADNVNGVSAETDESLELSVKLSF